MEKKLEIPFGNYKIVAEINDLNLPDIPPELCVSICNKNNVIIQDICLVRENYRYDRNTHEFKWDDDFIDCLVWGDSDNEDFTDDFTIGICKEEE